MWIFLWQRQRWRRLYVKPSESYEHCGSDLLQQLVVSEAEGFLQQNGQHHAEDEETFLLRRAVLITDLNRDEPHQRGQQQRHQPEKCSERKTTRNTRLVIRRSKISGRYDLNSIMASERITENGTLFDFSPITLPDRIAWHLYWTVYLPIRFSQALSDHKWLWHPAL